MADVAFPIPKGSPYKIFLEQAINDIIESGTLERIKKIWAKTKRDCAPILVTGKSLDYQKMAGVYLLLILGLGLTLFVIVGEMIVANVAKIKQPKKDNQNISS